MLGKVVRLNRMTSAGACQGLICIEKLLKDFNEEQVKTITISTLLKPIKNDFTVKTKHIFTDLVKNKIIELKNCRNIKRSDN